MEITETTSLCFYECESTHYRSPSATAAVHERSAQSTSLLLPSSIVHQSPVINHSLGKFALAWSTDNQSNHRNQQYSIIALTDDAGAILERYSYTAYGKPAFFDGAGSLLQTSNFSIRTSFSGREYDPIIHLYHYRARMYDPQLGRFLGRDPIGYRGGVNLMAIVGGQVLVQVDPFGLLSATEQGMVWLTFLIHAYLTPGFGWWSDWLGLQTTDANATFGDPTIRSTANDLIAGVP